MDKNMQVIEVTLRGFYNEGTNVFHIAGVTSPEDVRKPRRHNVKRNLFKEKLGNAKEVMGRIIRKAKMVYIRYNEGLNLFCDDEGRIYFVDDDGVRQFISADSKYSLSELGEYYRLIEVDEGFELDLIPEFRDAFPFRYVSEPKEEEFDFEDMSGFEPLEEVDPFAEPIKRENKVIDFEVAKFLHEREGRGR